MKKYIYILAPIIIGMLCVIFSRTMPSFWMEMVFTILCLIDIVLIIEKGEYGRIIWPPFFVLLQILICGLVIWPIVSADSFAEYKQELSYSLWPEKYEERLYTDMASQNNEIIGNLMDIDSHMSETEDTVELLKAQIYEDMFWYGQNDPEEISAIAEQITREYSNYPDSYPNIKLDVNSVEIFYKMKLSNMEYHYHNIVEALEACGIRCKEMSIDEHTLMLWDMEMLYNYYSMYKGMQEDAAEDVTYEDNRNLFYNDYKISLNEYSDTFDYKGWFLPCVDTARGTVNDLYNYIMSYYSKFATNFS